MRAGLDEDYWYGKIGWPRLRGKVVSLAISRSGDFLQGLKDPGPDAGEAITRFVTDLVTSIGQTADRQFLVQISEEGADSDMSPTSTLWSFALSLFGDVEALCDALARETLLLGGKTNRDVQPKQALGQILRSFLENARRMQMPATLHRQTAWETMDRVSLEVSRLNVGNVLEQRCSDEHVEEVRRVLRVEYPTNKNVNVSLGTLRGYFDEFCSDCEQRNHSELLALQSETGAWPSLDPCLEHLKGHSMELWDSLAVQFGFSDAEGATQQTYLTTNGVSRTTFAKRLAQAQEFMRNCIKDPLEFQLRRWP
jgi:hypothetical protein